MISLDVGWVGAQRIELASCASTNDEAARLARAGAQHGTLVIADAQTAGRGREGRSWASPTGGLYMSLIARPALPLATIPAMTLAIGVALCDAVRAVGVAAVLKWPNDLLTAEHRKLAGVLVEAQSQGARLESVVIGIGVNLAGAPPLATASTLEAEGVACSREAFLAALLPRLEDWIDRYLACGVPAVIPAWEARMAVGLPARARIDGEDVVGIVAGLAPDGAVRIVDAASVEHRVRSGDVELAAAPQ